MPARQRVVAPSAVAACWPRLVVGVAIFRHVQATSSSSTPVLFIINTRTLSYAKLRLVVLTLLAHAQPLASPTWSLLGTECASFVKWAA